ncbi:uncharacterized protein BHQ10_004894 [Talaromyces amestolkiae]|uniref:NAD-dependent epimerase/dehydratase domain-containing protein n=1 Tax=Talaromyces amestolkiae TaxID=1196081 RepID=A0A364KZA6_TALAM|nr:uncharacterized protein BHQ10_004894 [Talaromyces amestolkiae]RAO68882.1 hypothetical protein BHQ10_004894 [Talaromyces amestolkiae]
MAQSHHSHHSHFTEVNRQYFDKTARDYDTGFEKGISMMREETLRHRLWISSRWTDTAEGKGKEIRLLEYACGPGHVTRTLEPFVTKCLGLDVSENMVAVYNQRVEEAGIPSEKMSAKVGDLLAENVSEDLQGPEYRDLDIIIVSMALHHFSDPQLALKRLADRLQKGGVLWIVEMLEEPHAKDEHERVSPETAQIVHKHGFGVDEMKDLFLGAGLGDADVKILDRRLFKPHTSPHLRSTHATIVSWRAGTESIGQSSFTTVFWGDRSTMQKCRAFNGALGRKALAPTPAIGRVQFQVQRRNIQDVHITRTGKPILKIQGGRSSLGGHTATVFGATGFLGRYIVNRLARAGCTVVVPFREEMTKRHLKVSGDLGRVVFTEYDLRNTQSIEESVRHSDVVYNLVGRDYPTKNFTYEDVHVDGAERIAEAVAKYDVDRFIHVSSYNAAEDSPSEFFKTKGWGERVVREIFPETTIVRPAPMFGFEDHLLHKLAGVTNLLTANHMQEKYWPVHAIDVGTALERMLYDDNTASQTFELYGPKQYSTAELAEIVDKEIIKHRRHINLPKAVLKPAAYYLNKYLWWPTMSADQIEREFIDQHIDPTAKTFKDLDIEPAEINSLTYLYLMGYRSSQYYDLPPATEREQREEKKYLHVLDDQ